MLRKPAGPGPVKPLYNYAPQYYWRPVGGYEVLFGGQRPFDAAANAASDYPSATPLPPIAALSFLVTLSMRSAAAFSEAAAIAAWAALLAIGARHLRLLDRHQFFLQTPEPQAHLAKFVGYGQCRHHRQPGVADLAEFGAQRFDANVKLAREPAKMFFLAVLARHAELSPVDVTLT